MAAPFDNSAEQNLSGSLPRIGEGVVIDIGTGDGRFVSASARGNPKFYIGIDANVKPLEKPSMKATRKITKGGLPNALFVQAAVEDLPVELNGVADETYTFPMGQPLQGVATGDAIVVAALRRIAASECGLEIIIGIDPVRDQTEIGRLGLPTLSTEYLKKELIPKYTTAGFVHLEHGTIDSDEWSQLETSWARRLQNDGERNVTYMIFQAA